MFHHCGLHHSKRQRRTKVDLLVSRNSPLPHFRHILLVDHAHWLIVDATKRRLELKISQRPENCGNCQKGNGVNSVQYGRSTSILEHPVRGNKFRKRPSDYGQHSKSSMSKFRFLHGVQVILLSETKGVESVVSCVRTVQCRGASHERQGNRVLPIVVASTVLFFMCARKKQIRKPSWWEKSGP